MRPHLLLIHAGPADRRMWAPVIELLGDEFDVLAPDLRGFGDNPPAGGPFTHAGDLASLLDERGIEAPLVVGNSFGGKVALELAATRPVAGLVLLCAAWDTEPSERFQSFADAEEAAIEDGRVDDAVELNVEMWAPAGHEALVREMQALAFRHQVGAPDDEQEVEVELASIAAPATVVYGETDLEDFEAIARRLARELPNATLRSLPAGHLMPLERPDLVADLIRAARPG